MQPVLILQVLGWGQGIADQKSVDVIEEGIIHDSVPFVSFQKIRGIMPYFSNDQRIRLLSLDCLAEFLPEAMGISSPTSNLHPSMSHSRIQ